MFKTSLLFLNFCLCVYIKFWPEVNPWTFTVKGSGFDFLWPTRINLIPYKLDHPYKMYHCFLTRPCLIWIASNVPSHRTAVWSQWSRIGSASVYWTFACLHTSGCLVVIPIIRVTDWRATVWWLNRILTCTCARPSTYRHLCLQSVYVLMHLCKGGLNIWNVKIQIILSVRHDGSPNFNPTVPLPICNVQPERYNKLTALVVGKPLISCREQFDEPIHIYK